MAPAEASSSFLGLGPSARDPSSLRRRRCRGSRNRKKSWKRWAGPEGALGRDIADFLEDVALQQRAAGGLLSEQPDSGLFFLDTGAALQGEQQKKRSKEKPLHVDLVLQPDSKVPPPKDILAHQVPNGGKARRQQRFWALRAEQGVFPRHQRKLQAQLQSRNRPQGPKPPERGRSDPQRDFYNIWEAENPLEQPLVGQDPWFLQQTKKQRVKVPPRLLQKPSQLPAIQPLPPGASYNPTFQDHQALLLQAHEEELRKKREEEKVERQLRLPPGAELPTQESQFQEQCEGLVEEEEEEEEEEAEAPSPPSGDPLGTAQGVGDTPGTSQGVGDTPGTAQGTLAAGKAQRGEKKTEKQRRKEKEARAQAVQKQQQRRARGLQQELFRLRRLRQELLRRQELLQLRREQRQKQRQEKEKLPRRLGRLKFQEAALDVLLSQELPECLRRLQPQGSLLRDRFKSFQRRNMIEPRERAKFKRRYRVKYVEKRSFRELTL